MEKLHANIIPRRQKAPSRGALAASCLAAVILLTLPPSARAQEASSAVDRGEGATTFDPEGGPRPYRIRAVGEAGFLAVLSHRVQFDSNGTYVDYVEEGGQDTLFFVGRLSLELELYRQHRIVLLYQPLGIQTSVVASRDVEVNEEVFEEGTPLDLSYDFPFYRISYMYDFFANRRLEVALGLSLQIRNATITFRSGDGSQLRTERDVGPVPLIKFRATYHFLNGFWVGAEIDGIYAPISYLNGSDTEITGALLDASLRAGLVLPRGVQAFLNLRYLGGGAEGSGSDDDEDDPGDGYTRNWLHFLTVTAGVNWDII